METSSCTTPRSRTSSLILERTGTITGFIGLEDVIAAKPDAIQDHTHFDQQHHAVEIASLSGADYVTDLGGCLFTKVTAVEEGFDPATINCNLIRKANGEPFFTPGGLPGMCAGQGLDLGVIEFTDYGEKGWPERPIPGLDEAMAVQVKQGPSFFNRPYPTTCPGRISIRSADIIEDYQGNPDEIAQKSTASTRRSTRKGPTWAGW